MTRTEAGNAAWRVTTISCTPSRRSQAKSIGWNNWMPTIPTMRSTDSKLPFQKCIACESHTSKVSSAGPRRWSGRRKGRQRRRSGDVIGDRRSELLDHRGACDKSDRFCNVAGNNSITCCRRFKTRDSHAASVGGLVSPVPAPMHAGLRKTGESSCSGRLSLAHSLSFLIGWRTAPTLPRRSNGADRS